MKLQLLFLFLPIMVVFIGCDEPDKSKDTDTHQTFQENDSVRPDSPKRDHTLVAPDTLVPDTKGRNTAPHVQ